MTKQAAAGNGAEQKGHVPLDGGIVARPVAVVRDRSLIAATNASRKMAIRHTALSCFFAVISLVRPRCRLSLAPTAGSRRRRAQVVSRLAASSAATEGLALMRP